LVYSATRGEVFGVPGIKAKTRGLKKRAPTLVPKKPGKNPKKIASGPGARTGRHRKKGKGERFLNIESRKV